MLLGREKQIVEATDITTADMLYQLGNFETKELTYEAPGHPFPVKLELSDLGDEGVRLDISAPHIELGRGVRHDGIDLSPGEHGLNSVINQLGDDFLDNAVLSPIPDMTLIPKGMV